MEEKKIKTREQNKGRKIKTLLSSPIHLAHHRSTVALLSLRYRSAIAPLLLRYRSAIATLSHRYRYAVTLLSLRCRTAIVPLSFRCLYAAVTPLSRCYHTAIAPVLLHSCFAAVAPAVNTQSQRYRTASAVNRKVHTVVASRGIIRATVTVEQKQFSIELFIPSLVRSDSGSTTAQQQMDSVAILVQQRSKNGLKVE